MKHLRAAQTRVDEAYAWAAEGTLETPARMAPLVAERDAQSAAVETLLATLLRDRARIERLIEQTEREIEALLSGRSVSPAPAWARRRGAPTRRGRAGRGPGGEARCARRAPTRAEDAVGGA